MGRHPKPHNASEADVFMDDAVSIFKEYITYILMPVLKISRY